MSRWNVGARAACCGAAAGSVAREHAAAAATSARTASAGFSPRLRTRRLYKRRGGSEDPPLSLPASPVPPALPASEASPASEARRQVEPHVSRCVDRRRIEPRATVGGAVLIRRLVRGRVVGVEQVVQIEPGVEPRAAETDDLRD